MLPLNSLIQPIWAVAPYPIAVINLDSDPEKRKFVYINPAFTALTGYSSAEAVGRAATLLNGLRTSTQAVQEYEQAVVQGRACTTALLHYRKDGSEYVANASIAPLLEPDGTAEYLILVETILTPARLPQAADRTAVHGIGVPLSLPMPAKEFPSAPLPRHLTSHPALDHVRSLWSELRGDRPLPLRSDFDLQTMARWVANLSIATVTLEGRYRFRLFGSELARVYGQDLTGRFLDELAPRDLWAVITLHYDDVMLTLEPLFAPISIANGRWYTEVSRLLLPLAAEGDSDTVAFIMGIDYMRF